MVNGGSDHETTKVIGQEENAAIDGAYILAGSFNPLHDGHKNLLKAVETKFNSDKCFFELSLANCDKGAVDLQSMYKRFM